MFYSICFFERILARFVGTFLKIENIKRNFIGFVEINDIHDDSNTVDVLKCHIILYIPFE